MRGNSQRRGATRKASKGNPTAGSGGRVRRGLEGKGPTPKAAERPNHKAYKAKLSAEKSSRPRPGGKAGAKRGSEAEWIAGRNSVVEALRAQMPVSSIHMAEGAERDGRLREVLETAADRGIALMEVPRVELDRITAGAVHQGLAARVPAYEYAHPDELLQVSTGERPLIVALDSVTDPRNLGAVVRSAAGFGAHGVLIPERRAAGMTASAWKTSAGAAARIPVARAVNLTRQLQAYQKAGCMVVGLAADGEVSLPDFDLGDGPLVIVVGSEGKGLSRLVAQTCDQRVAIPMSSSLESLNAGVAASIVLYEVAQSRSRR